jgi:AAA domain
MEELDRRIGAACLHFGITHQEIEGWLFVDSGRNTNSKIVLATPTRNGVMIAVPMVEALLKTIADNQIDVVQIDPFISSHNVPENDNNAIDVVAKAWAGIADATNTAIDLAHHSRKTGGAEVTVEDGRGAVALINACRSARVLNTMTDDEAAKAGVTGHHSYFKLTNGKLNLAPRPDRADWFHTLSVDLGNGGDPGNLLDVGDKVGVVTAWQWPDPLDGVTGRDFDKVAAVIRAGEWRHSSQANAWVGYAVAKALWLDITKKADKAKVHGLLKVWLAAGSLVVVKRLDPDRREKKDFVEVAPED